MNARKGAGRTAGVQLQLGDQMLSVQRLHLDSKNPRHEPLRSEAEVIAQLCNEELVTELAQDIATRGALSPLDVLGVIPLEGNPGHYVAVEGNRRTCALILLSDPSRAPTAFRAQIQRLAATADVPKEIKVHVFADRAAAKPWIDLRHLGPQGGIGTRDWNADQKTRAAGGNTRASSRANTLALLVLDRLVQRGLITSEQREKVSLTTVTRYLGTPGVRAILGLASSAELVYTHDPAEVDAALCQLVLDSITPGSGGRFEVHSRANSSDRLGYARRLKSKGSAPATLLPTPTPPAAAAATASPASFAAKKRSARNPADLPTLFNRSFTVAHKDPILLRLREEALKLSLEEFPFSGNYLLRAFVEQTMILFAKKRGKYSSSMTDEQLSQTCAAELKAMGTTGKALSVINKAAGSAAQPYSLHSLGHAVHGASVPTRQSLRAICDTWQPSLRAMLDAL